MSKKGLWNWMLTSALAVLIFPGCNDKADPPPPNILFIMSDDHSRKAISCYGSTVIHTASIDRIANEGIRFDNCFCTNSLCAPSRAVILTGLYSHLNGITGNERHGFDGSSQTLPKLLQNSGYQTAMIGKWHLGSEPTGFDYWHVLPGQGVYHDPVFLSMGDTIRYNGYTADIITDLCMDWLKGRDRDKPFLLFCHFKTPHAPHDFKEEYGQHFSDPLPEPQTLEDDYQSRKFAARPGEFYRLENMHRYDLREPAPMLEDSLELRKWYFQKFFRGYYRVVAAMDDNIGRLLDYIDNEKLTERTLVVYTSDNGFFLGDHGWYNKMWMYKESFRLPLVMRYPAMIPASTQNDDFILNLDFAPTFLDLAGLDIPADMQGKSIKALFSRDRDDTVFRDAVYYHYHGQYGVPAHRGIRTDRYKLIHFYMDDYWELFDLQNDPLELQNIYKDPCQRGNIEDLKNRLTLLQEKYADTETI